MGSVILLANGCATSHHQETSSGMETSGAAQVEVPNEPPEGIVETVNPEPEENLAWVAGAWTWQGHWVWVPGHWAKPPRQGAVWVASRLVVQGNRHLWIRGYWR